MIVNLKLERRKEYSRTCLFCERSVAGYYYDLDINFIHDGINSGIFKNLCLDCYSALRTYFRGRD